MGRRRAFWLALPAVLALVLASCSGDKALDAEPSQGTASPAATPATESPYAFSDCESLEPGDPLDFSDLRCREQIQIETLTCMGSVIYVRLIRPGRDDLEGLVGRTPTWRKAGVPDAAHGGRTPWSFANCIEVE